MDNYILRDGCVQFQRVNKFKARKLHSAGVNLVICPCKLNPFGMFRPSMALFADEDRSFDDMVQDFEWYNCTHETGKYASFYAPI